MGLRMDEYELPRRGVDVNPFHAEQQGIKRQVDACAEEIEAYKQKLRDLKAKHRQLEQDLDDVTMQSNRWRRNHVASSDSATSSGDELSSDEYATPQGSTPQSPGHPRHEPPTRPSSTQGPPGFIPGSQSLQNGNAQGPGQQSSRLADPSPPGFGSRSVDRGGNDPGQQLQSLFIGRTRARASTEGPAKPPPGAEQPPARDASSLRSGSVHSMDEAQPAHAGANGELRRPSRSERTGSGLYQPPGQRSAGAAPAADKQSSSDGFQALFPAPNKAPAQPAGGQVPEAAAQGSHPRGYPPASRSSVFTRLVSQPREPDLPPGYPAEARQPVFSRLGSHAGAAASPPSADSPLNGSPPAADAARPPAPPGYEQRQAHVTSRLGPAAPPSEREPSRAGQPLPQQGSALLPEPRLPVRSRSELGTSQDGGFFDGFERRQAEPSRQREEWGGDRAEQPRAASNDRARWGHDGFSELASGRSQHYQGDSRREPPQYRGDRWDRRGSQAQPDWGDFESAQPERPFEEQFPNLGVTNRQKEADFQAADFPALSSTSGPSSGLPKPPGAWGSGRTTHLQGGGASGTVNALPRPPQSAEAAAREEVRAGLRQRDDPLPDHSRQSQVGRKKDFTHIQEVRGRRVNVVEGLELHTNVLSPDEQRVVVRQIEDWVEQGRQNLLKGRTFSAPRKSMRGKGRITVQFGCCYNYAVDAQDRPPGIIAEEVVEAMPPLLMALVHRLVRWGVIAPSRAPDSAIINIYEEDDCIPPHIDHHDFSRPFVTLSLLSQENIMFGYKLIPFAPGEFGCRDDSGECEIPLPPGSCLVLAGNGADVAMHCVPPVKRRRMSITLRKMQMEHAERVKLEIDRAGRLGVTERAGSVPRGSALADALSLAQRKGKAKWGDED